MKNEIYLNFDTVRYYLDDPSCYDFGLSVSEGCSWVVEWGDGAWNRHTGSQSESHVFPDFGMQSIHIFVEDEVIFSGSSHGGVFAGN